MQPVSATGSVAWPTRTPGIMTRRRGAGARLTSSRRARPSVTSPATSSPRPTSARAKGMASARRSPSASAAAAARADAAGCWRSVASKTSAISPSRRAQRRRASAREHLRDGGVHDGRLALGLDLLRDHEPAVAGFQQRDGVLAERGGIHEPAAQLRQFEQRGAMLERRGIGGGRRRGVGEQGIGCGARREQRAPARELGRGRGARGRVQRQRLRHQGLGALGRGGQPGQLLRLAQRALLGLEPLAGDRPARGLEDARLVIEDEGAEPEAAAQPALEDDPARARARAVDAGQPGGGGALRLAPDEGARARARLGWRPAPSPPGSGDRARAGRSCARSCRPRRRPASRWSSGAAAAPC